MISTHLTGREEESASFNSHVFLAVCAFLALFVSDNLLWFASFTNPRTQWQAFALTHDEKNVLDWLSQHQNAPAYVVSSDQRINYLTSTYTNLRAWRGHDLNTPQVSLRQSEVTAAFSAQEPIPTRNPVYYIPERAKNWTPPTGSSLMYSNNSYDVWLSQ